MSHSTKVGTFGQNNQLKNNTNNFDLLCFNRKSEHLTAMKHICSQEILCNNTFFTYFNSYTGINVIPVTTT